MNIMPQEFNILSDHYVIRTRVPVGEMKDEMVLSRVRAANLTPGDRVTVQCMSHGYDQLFHEAEYRVISRKEELRVVQLTDRDTKQVFDTNLVIARKGEWWASPLVDKVDETVIGVPVAVEHRGGGSYAVVDGNGVVLCIIGKNEGGKERAESIVAGVEPIPQAA